LPGAGTDPRSRFKRLRLDRRLLRSLDPLAKRSRPSSPRTAILTRRVSCLAGLSRDELANAVELRPGISRCPCSTPRDVAVALSIATNTSGFGAPLEALVRARGEHPKIALGRAARCWPFRHPNGRYRLELCLQNICTVRLVCLQLWGVLSAVSRSWITLVRCWWGRPDW